MLIVEADTVDAKSKLTRAGNCDDGSRVLIAEADTVDAKSKLTRSDN